KSNNKLPSGQNIEDSLQEAIIQIQEKGLFKMYISRVVPNQYWYIS
ncbi:14900_t:CDS:1, partial [Cetraspora pellucida]